MAETDRNARAMRETYIGVAVAGLSIKFARVGATTWQVVVGSGLIGTKAVRDGASTGELCDSSTGRNPDEADAKAIDVAVAATSLFEEYNMVPVLLLARLGFLG